MITRLRRAMAPPPTKEQLGEVIHAMVQEIVRDARRRGIGLKLTRQAPCVYLFELRGAASKKGKGDTARVVHLSIDSGRLSVKVGGGHENLLEYIERYHFLSSV
ncbi:putative myosin heavy chain [Trypanosoma cruzi]|nr:putative myosin heavy chain [Trypanosoma cruzi]